MIWVAVRRRTLSWSLKSTLLDRMASSMLTATRPLSATGAAMRA